MKNPTIIKHDFQEGGYLISYFVSPGRFIELKLREEDSKEKPLSDISETGFRDYALQLLEHAPKETGALVKKAKVSGKRINMLHGHGTSDKSKWKLELGLKKGPYISILRFLNSEDCAGWFVNCCNPGEYEFQEGQTENPVIYPGKSTSLSTIGFECPIWSTGLNNFQGDLETTINFLDSVWNSKYGFQANWEMHKKQYNRIKQEIEKVYK